ncbi:MAG: phage tail protein [Parasphingorhabdus sp.]
MATLVLTAVGTAVGGPIGGALGALAGQQIDQNILFKPAAREGPRIQELAVQTSSYGTQIPRIFGRMRVAGSVIWATDLKETKNTEGGKGRPDTTTYSYSACFAVALSSRPIREIGRIWADGNLFRGVAGDFKTATGFRILEGHEDQSRDGLIASAEGVDAAPAYRGMAIAVFEEMELADYGNRIPSLTFEVIADDGSINLVDIVNDISDHRISLYAQDRLLGYAASGENRRAAMDPIVDNFHLSFWAEHGQVFGQSRQNNASSERVIKPASYITDINGYEVEKPKFETVSETKIPRQLTLRYYEPERDYQSGSQSGFRPGNSRVITQLDFPAAINASLAKRISQERVWNMYYERSSASIEIPCDAYFGRLGDIVQLEDQKTWIIRNQEFRTGSVSLSLSGTGNHLEMRGLESDGGRSISDLDATAGVTRLALFDLPFAPETPNQAATSAQLFAIAAGGKGWRNADLYQTQADGSVGEFVGKLSTPGILGSVEQVFGSGSALLLDQNTTVTVKLHHSDMRLNDADDFQLSAGKNVAIIGREIIQFSRVEALGNGRYLLSHFYRGLAGTERFIDNHNSQEDFILFERASATAISPNHFTLFEPTRFAALGRDDAVPVFAEIDSPGSALKPWQPVHLKHSYNSSGDLELGWTRRSRKRSSWADHVDIPLAEEVEEYSIRWERASGELLGQTLVGTPSFKLGQAQISMFRDQGVSQIQFSVRQRGQHTQSAPAILTVST